MPQRIALNLALSLLALTTLVFAKVPRPLANVTLSLPDGKKTPIQQFKGKVMAVALVATNCETCPVTMDLLIKAQKTYGPRGFQAVAATVNIDAPLETKDWVARIHPNFPTGYLDHPGMIKLADLQATDQPFVPILLFVDKKGIVRYQYLGDDPIMKQLPTIINGLVDKLLKEE